MDAEESSGHEWFTSKADRSAKRHEQEAARARAAGKPGDASTETGRDIGVLLTDEADRRGHDGHGGGIEGWLDDIMDQAEAANRVWIPGHTSGTGDASENYEEEAVGGPDEFDHVPADAEFTPEDLETGSDDDAYWVTVRHPSADLGDNHPTARANIPWTDESFFTNPRHVEKHTMLEYCYYNVFDKESSTGQRRKLLGTEKTINNRSIICRCELHKDPPAQLPQQYQRPKAEST